MTMMTCDVKWRCDGALGLHSHHDQSPLSGIHSAVVKRPAHGSDRTMASAATGSAAGSGGAVDAAYTGSAGVSNVVVAASFHRCACRPTLDTQAQRATHS
jgi:hypothetical protein